MADLSGAAQRRLKKFLRDDQGTGGVIIPDAAGRRMFLAAQPIKEGLFDIDERNARQEVAAAARGESTPESYINNRFVEDADLNPATYLKSVYRNVPGGAEEAIKSANEARKGTVLASLDPEKLDRNVRTWWSSNLHKSNPGVYSPDEDRIVFAQGISREDRASVARHELQHAIADKDAAHKGRYYTSGGAVATSTVGEKKLEEQRAAAGRARYGSGWSEVPPQNSVITSKPNLPEIDKYYGNASEANAEFLAPIKHWAAERGWLIRTPEEGKRAFEQYMKETGLGKEPVGPGDNLKDRRPAILRRLYRKGAWRELPTIVENSTPAQDEADYG